VIKAFKTSHLQKPGRKDLHGFASLALSRTIRETTKNF
jgi:hypothetical protein